MAPESTEALVDRAIPPSKTGTVSVLAREFGRDVFAAKNPDTALPPASNAKLVTTALALDRLGPQYRFETRLRATGERVGRCLRGDLMLTGRGAPDLSLADLDTLAERVAETGVERVTGDVVANGEWFGRRRIGPGWTADDEQYAYGAPSAALSLAGNTVDVSLTDSAEMGQFDADLEPVSDAVPVDVQLDADADTELRAHKERGGCEIRVRGHLPPGATRTVTAPVNDPLAHCGNVFRRSLERSGVAVDGSVVTGRRDAESRIASVRSAPLADLVRRMNVPSDNFVAEQLARTVARAETGRGTWDAWSELATETMQNLGAENVRLCDGSGLSRYNLVSARGLLAVLEWAADQVWGTAFFESLPRAGADGTLANRLTDVEAAVHAKTGTLTGTHALTGVIERPDGTRVGFAALLSNLTDEQEDVGRELLDELVRELAATD